MRKAGGCWIALPVRVTEALGFFAGGTTSESGASRHRFVCGGLGGPLSMNCLGGDEIAADCLGRDKIGANCLGRDKIAADCIGGNKIGVDCIGGDKIAADCLGRDKIGANCLGGDKIAADGLGRDKIGANCLGRDDIDADCLGRDEIAADCLGRDKTTADCLGGDEIATDCLGRDEIASPTLDGPARTPKRAPTTLSLISMDVSSFFRYCLALKIFSKQEKQGLHRNALGSSLAESSAGTMAFCAAPGNNRPANSWSTGSTDIPEALYNLRRLLAGRGD